MNIARMTSLRSTCPRRSVGAILLDDENRIISTGFNGSKSGEPHCIDVGCLTLDDDHCIRTIHAEQNVIGRARSQGVKMYCTDTPCLGCLKTIMAHNPGMIIYVWRWYADVARDLYARNNKIIFFALSKEEIEEMNAIYPITEKDKSYTW
jgi:dCMP deaminase